MQYKVYTCAYCCRKVHLAKFCYANLNMLNKNIWVRESTNPIGPKKIWVPKNTLKLIDVGVSSSSKTQRGDGALVVDASKLKGSTVTLHHYQEAPILEIAHGFIISPLENFISSQIYTCVGLASFSFVVIRFSCEYMPIFIFIACLYLSQFVNIAFVLYQPMICLPMCRVFFHAHLVDRYLCMYVCIDFCSYTCIYIFFIYQSCSWVLYLNPI